jgi:epoxyqueuosine reductase
MEMRNHPTFTQKIKEKAHQLGFQLVGVTSPKPPPHLEVYSKWVDSGYHAGMSWMATAAAQAKRADPLDVLPECKSILVLGILYPSPIQNNPGNKQMEGKIASYALGDDYHDVLPIRLKAIMEFIEELAGSPVPNRWYTDTGPILERDYAQMAGLGWIGKNTCLINPQLGSNFFLAEILLGIELEIDEPTSKDFCGSCTRCLDYCPTACITKDRMIDTNRCISYLTIEHRGFIPKDLRPLIGTWMFGCDVCQQVCPWNLKFSTVSHQPAEDNLYSNPWDPRPGVPPESLVDEMILTPQEFNRKYKGSPIKRTKRRGYLRNIAVALGNIGGLGAIPALLNALNDFEPIIRGHAAWALGEIGGEQALEGMKEAMHEEKDPEVQAEIQAALANIR